MSGPGGGGADARLEWSRGVANWMKADADDPEPPPPAPVGAILAAAYGGHSAIIDAHVLALATELSRTRADLAAAREAIRVLLGEAGLGGLHDLTTVDGRSVVDVVRRGMGVC